MARPPKATHSARSDRWRPKFLEVLAARGSVTEAAAAAGVDRATVYKARDRSEAFAAAWAEAEALGVAAAEDELRARAFDRDAPGSLKALLALLRGHLPERYAIVRRTEHTGAAGGPIEQRVVFYIPDNGRDGGDPPPAGPAGDLPRGPR